MGNREAKKLVGTTHRHELRWGNAGGSGGGECRAEGNKGKKIGTTVIA